MERPSWFELISFSFNYIWMKTGQGAYTYLFLEKATVETNPKKSHKRGASARKERNKSERLTQSADDVNDARVLRRTLRNRGAEAWC